MERIKITIPEKILFSYSFTIQPEDINEVHHVGNERVLVFANTIRAKLFEHLQLSLNDVEKGYGTIVANHSVHYKKEGFSGDEIVCHVGVNTITECSFDLVFHFMKNDKDTIILLRTGCVYYDYKNRKKYDERIRK